MLRLFFIQLKQSKYLNNLVEQDHRQIKRVIKPMLGFKSFATAKAILAGIELHHMLKKGHMPFWEQFYALAG